MLGGSAKAPSNDQFADFFGDALSSNGHAASTGEAAGQIVVNKHGLEVQLFVDSGFTGDKPAAVRFVIANNNPVRADNFLFQAAATKVRYSFALN